MVNNERGKMKTIILAAMLSAVLVGECNDMTNRVAHAIGDESAVCTFPTINEARAECKRINLRFVASETGRDNWKDFIPLLERVVKSQSSVSNRHEMLKIEFEILEWATLFAFACEYDFDEIKADFASRLACLDLECRLEYVRSDTNGVMMIADWLGGAQPIVVDEETRKQREYEMSRIDRQMIYGGRFLPCRGFGRISSWGGLSDPQLRSPYLTREFLAQRCRRKYNRDLPVFRRHAEARMRHFVFEEFKAKNKLEREALWAEFCRRAKFATK